MAKNSTIGRIIILTAAITLCPVKALSAEKTVTVSKAGTLSSLITSSEKNTVTNLTVSGTLNGDDVLFIREMAGQDVEGNTTSGTLTVLNLAGVTLTNGGNAYYKDSWSSYYTATSYDVNDDEDEYYCTDLSYAFTGTNLKQVVWPNTMWEVGTDALSYCTGLTSVTLGSETNEIKSRAFYGCSSLPGITLSEKILYVDDYAFAGCSSLKSIALPSEIETVYRNTFDGCKTLETVTIGSSVTDIREKAFAGCSSLKSITLPDALTKLGNNAFDGCSSLTAITLPKKLRTIGTSVFDGCTSLNDIKVASDNSYFTAVDGVLFDKAMTTLKVCPVGKTGQYTVPEGTETIDENAFGRCSGLSAITLPSTLTTISDEAFYRCTGLSALVIPNSVTSIGENAFYRCSSLKGITLGSGMTKIGESTFYYCTGLENITVPDGYTSLGYEAFAGCSALKTVDLPSTITAIGAEAFSSCSSLEKFISRTTAPVTISADTFDDVELSSCQLFVPEASIESYKADSQWSKFGSIAAITATGVNTIKANTESLVTTVKAGIVTVSGAKAGSRISLYGVGGSIVATATANDQGQASLEAPQRGFYVVSDGSHATKVAL